MVLRPFITRKSRALGRGLLAIIGACRSLGRLLAPAACSRRPVPVLSLRKMSDSGDQLGDGAKEASSGGGNWSTAPTRVLIADSDRVSGRVVAYLLADEGYVCAAAGTVREALDALRASKFDLALCDLRLPDGDGLSLLDRLTSEHPSTAVIMLAGPGDSEKAVECLRRGAFDCLLRPSKATDLVRSIERALARRRLDLARRRYRTSLEWRVREKTAELSKALREVESAYSSTLHALVAALDAREQETSDHSQRVVRFTLAVAERLEVPEAERPDIARGALLHDIGKIGVPDAILLKKGPLLPDEWREMRRHPQTGYTILKSIPFLRTPAEIVLAHQERFDGSGYPRGLAGEAIILGSRIFAIADALDAITSDRPYRKGAPLEQAREEIAKCSGTQFDPRCIEAFFSLDLEVIDSLRWPDPYPVAV